MARLGIARTFQNIRLFGDLPVIDNVKAGLQARARRSLVGTLLTTPGFRRQERRLTDRARELLTLFGLDEHRDRLARHLPYGDQRRLEIARAVATEPADPPARRAERRHEPGRDPGAAGADPPAP